MGLARLVIDSLRKRGVRRTIDLARTDLAERLFDWRYGTDTATRVELASLGVAAQDCMDRRRYEATGVRPFRKLMRALRVSKDQTFVDLGCGKGRVLLLAAREGFQKIIGIEFTEQLCAVARDNIAAYKKRTGSQADIAVVHADAASYPIHDNDGVFYLYNSFRAEILEVVLENIRRSLARTPRKVLLIYHNPVCRDVLEKAPLFSIRNDYVLSERTFVVYRNE